MSGPAAVESARATESARAATESVEAWALVARRADAKSLGNVARASRGLRGAVRAALELNGDWDVRARHLAAVPANVVRLRVWQIPRARLCVLSDELPVETLTPSPAPRLRELTVHAARAVPTAWARALEAAPRLREVDVTVERDAVAGLDALVRLGAPRLEKLRVTMLGPRRPARAPVDGRVVESDTLREYVDDVHAFGVDAPLELLAVRDFECTPCLARMRGRSLQCPRVRWSTPWARLPAAFAFKACRDLALDVRGVWGHTPFETVVGQLARLRDHMPALERLDVAVELHAVDRGAREVRAPPRAFEGIDHVRLRVTWVPLGFAASLRDNGAGRFTLVAEERLTADLERQLQELLDEGVASDDGQVAWLRERIQEFELLAAAT